MQMQYETAPPKSTPQPVRDLPSIEWAPKLPPLPQTEPATRERGLRVNDGFAVELLVSSTILVGLLAALSTIVN